MKYLKTTILHLLASLIILLIISCESRNDKVNVDNKKYLSLVEFQDIVPNAKKITENGDFNYYRSDSLFEFIRYSDWSGDYYSVVISKFGKKITKTVRIHSGAMEDNPFSFKSTPTKIDKSLWRELLNIYDQNKIDTLINGTPKEWKLADGISTCLNIKFGSRYKSINPLVMNNSERVCLFHVFFESDEMILNIKKDLKNHSNELLSFYPCSENFEIE